MMTVAILAGGLATRMRPLTETIPKSLLSVAGRPFLAHQLDYLRRQGIERAVLCVGYLGEMIQADFGDGSAYGIHLDYSFDGAVLLGTGGAIRKALPLLGRSFLVLYGDSYLPIDFRDVERVFAASGKRGLMTVCRNDNQWDLSNVRFTDGRIEKYDKKSRTPDMLHIDYGLSVFDASVFEDYSEQEKFDLAGVMSGLVERGDLAGYETGRRFYEIGSPTGLAETEQYLLSGANP